MGNKAFTQKSSGMDIPDYVIDSIARTLLPIIQKYYESNGREENLDNSQ